MVRLMPLLVSTHAHTYERPWHINKELTWQTLTTTGLLDSTCVLGGEIRFLLLNSQMAGVGMNLGCPRTLERNKGGTKVSTPPCQVSTRSKMPPDLTPNACNRNYAGS